MLLADTSGSRRKRMREEHTSLGSSAPSTSGRSIASHIYQHNAEIDSFICIKTEKLTSGLEEMRKRHCRGLLSVLEQQAAKLLQEKDKELAIALLRNTELEQKVKQMAMEGQFWFNVASSNESIAAGLWLNLQQIHLSSIVATGDQADDTASCCFEENERERRNAVTGETDAAWTINCRWSCKVCWERDFSVLLLPCSHLCLCTNCEPAMDTCPICHCKKNASIQIFMS